MVVLSAKAGLHKSHVKNLYISTGFFKTWPLGFRLLPARASTWWNHSSQCLATATLCSISVKMWPLGFRLAAGQSGAQKCGVLDVLVSTAG